MKRLPLLFLVIGLFGVAVAFSGHDRPRLETRFGLEDRNPITHLRWNQAPDDFQFAIVSDRTGGHRANVFTQGVAKLNLLQPEFVMSVGDLIEGTRDVKQLQAQWREFDVLAQRLTMPSFYVPGNHDLGNPVSFEVWQKKLGRRHYHFLYRNVLFLILNSDDPAGSNANIGKEQIAWARKVLADNAAVRWTLVFVHRPLWWDGDAAKNGWLAVEDALGGRRYTVFAGHVHKFQKFVRQGMNYYQLATTGGGSLLRGVEENEVDQLVWVTMKKDGPILANLLLDSIQAEDLGKFPTDEPGKKIDKKPTYPVLGKAFFEGTPIPGALVLFQSPAGLLKTVIKAQGYVAADGTFRLSTYTAHDGAPEGVYQVTVVWRQPRFDATGKPGPNRLPARYAKVETSGFQATVRPGDNEILLELRK